MRARRWPSRPARASSSPTSPSTGGRPIRASRRRIWSSPRSSASGDGIHMTEHGARAPSPPSGGEGRPPSLKLWRGFSLVPPSAAKADRGEGAAPRVVSGVVASLKLSAPPPAPLPARAGRGSAAAVRCKRRLDLARAGMLAIAAVACLCVVALIATILWLSFTDGTPGDPQLGYTVAHYVDVLTDRFTRRGRGHTLGLPPVALLRAFPLALPRARLG